VLDTGRTKLLVTPAAKLCKHAALLAHLSGGGRVVEGGEQGTDCVVAAATLDSERALAGRRRAVCKRQNHPACVAQEPCQLLSPAVRADVAPQADESGEREHHTIELARTAFGLVQPSETCVDVAAYLDAIDAAAGPAGQRTLEKARNILDPTRRRGSDPHGFASSKPSARLAVKDDYVTGIFT
jgi:hypothetical protein